MLLYVYSKRTNNLGVFYGLGQIQLSAFTTFIDTDYHTSPIVGKAVVIWNSQFGVSMALPKHRLIYNELRKAIEVGT